MAITATSIKEAVALAKAHIVDLFSDENISQIGLEEVEFDSEAREWKVTIGFARPEVRTGWRPEIIPMERTYKVVLISDVAKSIVAVKDRLLPV